MIENKIVKGIPVSRYVASWTRAGGTFSKHPRKGRRAFYRWLKTLEIDGVHLTDDERQQITNYANTGKWELEISSRMFLKTTT